LIATGFTFLPHTAWATIKSQENKQVSTVELVEYQIVVPDQASPVEQQAAEMLHHSKLAPWLVFFANTNISGQI
jgi:hypothetical protein